jgi:L-alanine-DL-glutamate epimerase-like enolase superfamily enzyme
VGFDVAADLARVACIQEAAAGRATLRLDANRAFSRVDGCAFASALEPQGIELFEQPCGSADWDSNAAVARVARVPVMLDESIYDIADIERAANLAGVGFVKLKLKKIGGVAMLEQALHRITALGLQPVLGDGVSTEIACWMEACVARTTIRNAGEMNGFLKVKADLFQEPLHFADGAVHLRAGYWPSLDQRAVNDHRIFTESIVR